MSGTQPTLQELRTNVVQGVQQLRGPRAATKSGGVGFCALSLLQFPFWQP